MNRSDGFPICDMDVGFYSDPKASALYRRLRDPARTVVYLGLYQSLVYASWAAGDRLTLDLGVPPWWTDPVDDVAADLEAVGYLDAEHRITEAAWSNNYLLAFDRREKRRASGAEGGRRSWESRRDRQRRSDAGPSPKHSAPGAEGTPNPLPTVPSVPTVRPSVAATTETTTATRDGRTTNRVPIEGPCRDCGGFLTDREPCRVGPGWIEHDAHPPARAGDR